MAAITSIHHAALRCRNGEEFARAVQLYRDILGLKTARCWGEGADAAIMLDTGAGMLEIFASGGEEDARGGWVHLAFGVTEPDVLLDAVRRAGFAVTVEAHDIVIPASPPCPARIAFFVGALGEEVELFETRPTQ